MIRTALSFKWLSLLAVVLAVCGLFGALGYWQLTVAQNAAHAEALEKAQARPVVELGEVLPPLSQLSASDVGRTVTVTGAFAAERQLVVPSRRLEGRAGQWVLSGFTTTQGVTVPVLRGFLAEGTPPAPPTGQLTLRGMVVPSEPPATTVRPGPGSSLTLDSVDMAAVVNHWPGPLHNAFLFAEGAARVTPAGPAPELVDGTTPQTGVLYHVPPPTFGDTDMNWRNFAYALQWWCFAAFALYMWWRMVKADAEAAAKAAGKSADTTPTEPDITPSTAEAS